MTSNWFHSEKSSFFLGSSCIWNESCPCCSRKCLNLRNKRIACQGCGFESRVRK